MKVVTVAKEALKEMPVAVQEALLARKSFIKVYAESGRYAVVDEGIEVYACPGFKWPFCYQLRY